MSTQYLLPHFHGKNRGKTLDLNELIIKLGISCVREPPFQCLVHTWNKDEDIQNM